MPTPTSKHCTGGSEGACLLVAPLADERLKLLQLLVQHAPRVRHMDPVARAQGGGSGIRDSALGWFHDERTEQQKLARSNLCGRIPWGASVAMILVEKKMVAGVTPPGSLFHCDGCQAAECSDWGGLGFVVYYFGPGRGGGAKAPITTDAPVGANRFADALGKHPPRDRPTRGDQWGGQTGRHPRGGRGSRWRGCIAGST